ncbi:MAG TPA: hypothetical protein VF700_05230, partial [Segetibacter sp.]
PGSKPGKMNKSNDNDQKSSLIILSKKDAIGYHNRPSYSARECLYARIVAAKVASQEGDSFPFSSIVMHYSSQFCRVPTASHLFK